MRQTRRPLERAAAVVRRVIGVPDYERYVEHMRAHHPSEQPLTHDAFMRQRLDDRYSKPGARCC
ncbi:MAG: YbdD/YjiX family protein [Gemmatimonadales bacterium]|jgi:uncharacterized short protein YbdD (DUF466 family)